MKHSPRIVVAIDANQAWLRGAANGLMKFIEENTAWDCQWGLLGEAIPQAIRAARFADGLIVDWRYVTPAAMRLKIPVIAVGYQPQFKVPFASPDIDAIARMAINHFLDRGFRRFAYFAFDGPPQAVRQGKAFAAELAARNYSCEWLQIPISAVPKMWRPMHVQLKKLLMNLVKPAAILASGDASARAVADACRECGIKVPQELAILGILNDDLRCRSRKPDLSSIDTGAEALGVAAGRLMEARLGGKSRKNEKVMVPPVRVVVRDSTDTVTVDDPMVAKVLRLIQDNLKQGVNVKWLAQHLDSSRRTLELAFRRHLGRTVHQEIVRAQLQRALRLLEDGEMGIWEVAGASGKRYRTNLGNFIKKHTGMTPLEYRAAHARTRT